MDRDIPVFNKIIMNKIHQKNMDIHYKNLINIRKSKRSKLSSTSTSFYKPNSKAYQIEQEKQTQIDKNNVMLFQKINNIVTRPKGTGNITRKLSSKKQIRQFDKIYSQNKKLVDRIANLKPTINNQKLMESRKKQLNILKFIGKVPSNTNEAYLKMNQLKDSYKIGKYYGNNNRQFRVKTQNYNPTDFEAQLDQNWNMSMAVRPRYNEQNKLKPSPKGKAQSISSSLTKYQIPPVQNKCINLFKCMKKIGLSSFAFSIIRTHNNYEITAEQICEGGKYYKIRLGQQKGKNLLQFIDYDYERLIQNLIISDKQLTISQNIAQKQSKIRQTPKPQVKKISQVMLPSHITQLNEEQFNIETQQAFAVDKNNRSYYLSSEDQSIMNTFLSFGDNS